MARTTKPRLGRGLSSLMSEPVEVSAPAEAAQETPAPISAPVARQTPASAQSTTNDKFLFVELKAITPSKFQARQTFSDDALEQLASSIRNAGVMQPVAVRAIEATVRKADGATWELIAGERRWRAAALAGLDRIPAVVVEATDREAAEWGIIENVQREDLNPIEAAHAYRNLQRRFGLTQMEIAERVGVDRSSVANILRLVELEPPIQQMIEAGELSLGHAKALLSAPSGKVRKALADRAKAEGMSVRALEEAAAEARSGGPAATAGGAQTPSAQERAEASANVTDLEKRLGEHLGTRVRVRLGASKKKGRIEIEFYDLDQFDGILTTIGFRDASPGS